MGDGTEIVMANKSITELESRSLSIFSKQYWTDAAAQIKSVKMLAYAAVFIALRVALKFVRIPAVQGLQFSFDCYVNSVGSLVYGPVIALVVGAITDTIGAIAAPSGPYFFPFIFVEMTSSFIFALFFWRRKLSVGRILLSKFTVNFICNIIMTSLCVKWSYAFFGTTGTVYNLINLSRIAKNLVMFPFEALLITLIFSAVIPPMIELKVLPKESDLGKINYKRLFITVGILTVISVSLILFYIFFLKGYISEHNIKLF